VGISKLEERRRRAEAGGADCMASSCCLKKILLFSLHVCNLIWGSMYVRCIKQQ
jgi:hypothetical protein